MDEVMKARTDEMKAQTEDFFKAAFCTDKAEVIHELKDFDVTGIVKLTSSDERGVFYVAMLSLKERTK